MGRPAPHLPLVVALTALVCSPACSVLLDRGELGSEQKPDAAADGGSGDGGGLHGSGDGDGGMGAGGAPDIGGDGAQARPGAGGDGDDAPGPADGADADVGTSGAGDGDGDDTAADGGGDGGDGDASDAAMPDADGPRPVVLFIDLLAVPRSGGVGDDGAFVTLYGERFTSDSRVFIGGVEVAAYVERGSDNHHARDIDRIVFQPGAEVPLGERQLVVRNTDGAESEPTAITINEAPILFVDPTSGDDGGDGSVANPLLTLDELAVRLAAGTVAYLREGSYGPSAGSCEDADHDCSLHLSALAADGTADAPIAIVGYPGERAVLGVPVSGAMDYWARGIVANDARHYTFAKLEVADTGLGIALLGGAGVRLVGNRIERMGIEGVSFGGTVNGLQLLGNRVREVTSMTNTNISVPDGSSAADYVVAYNDVSARSWSLILDANADAATRIYGNLLHSGLRVKGCGPGACPSDTIWIANNVFVGGGGLNLDGNAIEGRAVLFRNNSLLGTTSSVFRDHDTPNVSANVTLVNNVFSIAGPAHLCYLSATFTCEPTSDVGIGAEHNLWVGVSAGAVTWDLDPLVATSSGVGSSAMDFLPVAGGAAHDTGAAPMSTLPPAIMLDYFGSPRPVGAAWDLGAVERSAP